jgi:hypothetical protein
VEPGVGRNRAKTIVELVQVEMFLTTSDYRDGRLDHREAAIRVKGRYSQFVYSKAAIKGIVSRKFAILLLVSLGS